VTAAGRIVRSLTVEQHLAHFREGLIPLTERCGGGGTGHVAIEFDARLLVLEGEMTITRGDDERPYGAGDNFEMSAGCCHAERCGPEGARYLAGRRYRVKTTA
jgi:quercetin dioxygenase-like cupin family protein